MPNHGGSKHALRVQTTSSFHASTKARSMASPPTTPVGPFPTADWSARFDPEVMFDSMVTRRRTQALFEIPPPPFGMHTEDIENGSKVCLGSGAWAEVVRGTLVSGIRKTTVAIKKPRYPGAEEVLEQEARILSYITSAGPGVSVARFLGFDSMCTAIVMEHVAGTTLAQYSRSFRAKRLERGATTAARSQPVIGLEEWLDLSKQLTDTFVYLKSIGVVHGDVTWYNVLMKQTPTEHGLRPTPVVIDFSSGHLEVEGYRPAAVSATTTAFCSPELLEAHIRRPITPPLSRTDKLMQDDHHGPIPTYASDLYGLAMTLLSAAVGTEVYENAGRHGGIYARQGQPLEWVRNGDAFLIVGVRTMVSKLLSGCFGRFAEKRVGVEELQERIVSHIEGS